MREARAHAVDGLHVRAEGVPQSLLGGVGPLDEVRGCQIVWVGAVLGDGCRFLAGVHLKNQGDRLKTLSVRRFAEVFRPQRQGDRLGAEGVRRCGRGSHGR